MSFSSVWKNWCVWIRAAWPVSQVKQDCRVGSKIKQRTWKIIIINYLHCQMIFVLPLHEQLKLLEKISPSLDATFTNKMGQLVSVTSSGTFFRKTNVTARYIVTWLHFILPVSFQRNFWHLSILYGGENVGEDLDLQKKKGKSKQGPQGIIFSSFFFVFPTARLPESSGQHSVPGFHMQNLIVFWVSWLTALFMHAFFIISVCHSLIRKKVGID